MANRLTQLEAVNIVLRGARETPVSDLSTQTINEVQTALQILDEVDRKIQGIGWWFNTFEEDLTPDSTDNHVLLNTNTMWVRSWGQSLRAEVAFEHVGTELRLVNLEDPSDPYDWSHVTTVTVRYALLLDFENGLPYSIQNWIAREAAVEYQNSVLGSTTQHQILTGVRNEARASARRENIMLTDANMLNNSRSNMARAQARSAPRAWLPEGDGQRTWRRI